MHFTVVRKNAYNDMILDPNAVHGVLVEARLLTFLRPLYIAFMDRWSRFLSKRLGGNGLNGFHVRSRFPMRVIPQHYTVVKGKTTAVGL